jgi:predicted permease
VLLQDVRYALRNLWLNRGFASVAILCLSLGIGINTTIFSVLDGVLIQPFPYAEPERLVVLTMKNDHADIQRSSLSYLDLRDWRERNTTLAATAALSGRSLTIADGTGDPERFSGSAITWNLFPMLGVLPAWGRTFTADDDKPGSDLVVMLSYEVWTLRYRADPAAIGRSILVNARPRRIIGVMPPRFAFPQNAKLWVPLAAAPEDTARNVRDLQVYARLKPGVTQERAAAELTGIAKRLARQYPDTNEHWDADVWSLRDSFIPPDVRLVVVLMMAGATLVLLIACSNVANLLLARATVRRREISVRTALGAARKRIVRQLLTESIVLGLAAVPLGLALAFLGTKLLDGAMPPDRVPYYIHWRIDWRSVFYTVTVAAGTAALFALIPAFQSTRGNLHDNLKEGTRGNTGSRGWARNALVGAQVALSLVALVGALLFVRTFANLDNYPTGFDSKPLMTMRFYLPGAAYDVADAKARRVQDVVERVERLPGVQAVFASNLVPLNGGGGVGGALIIDGRPVTKGSEPQITFTGVTPHFARALNIQILHGRDFTDAEGWSRSANAIINQTMATKFWPNADPIGRRFRLTGSSDTDDWFTIIGIVSDIRPFGIDPDGKTQPSAYVPYIYQQTLNTGLTIRMPADPGSIAAAARAEIRASDANLPVFSVYTMEESRRLSFWQFGLFGWIFSSIGGLALFLAAVGVYGVLSYSVSQRQQEIGVRMALGAERHDVLRLIVGQGMRLALYGVVAGVAIAAVAMPAAKQLLYDVSPFDPVSFVVVALFLTTVAALASYIPARRATKVSPVVALRGE